MKKLVLITIWLSCLFHLTKAGNVETNARLDAPALYAANTSLSVSYDKLAVLGSFQPDFTTGLIEFGLDETKKLYHPTEFTSVLTCTYNVQILNGSTLFNVVKTLLINFHPTQAYKAQDFFKEANALNIFITGIDVKTYTNYGSTGQTQITNPNDLYIEASINADETPLFNFAGSLPLPAQMGYNTISMGGTPREVQVYWDYLNGAEEYELEYIYVDDYDFSGTYATTRAASAINYDFLHDATRIVTNNQYYNIPLVYERGYLLFRVRGIGRSKTNNGVRLEGTWSNAGFETGDVGTFMATYANQVYYISSAHELDKINWNCTRTFAENGKSGTGVSYEDGLMKNRQNIAKLNTENKTIVQSTLYDWHGRPAVSTLPSPMADQHFGYKTNTNMYSATAAFDKDVFDNVANFSGGSLCTPSGLSMSNVHSSGAAKYYSPNNPDKEMQQGLIPDAFGKPFVQVEYYPDQTGRIKRQTVPGNTHYLGSGRELQYYYAQPSQVELCRLFGTEVGKYDEYEKNIMIDPNGQIAVSYHDDEGRVIASGLYGANPSNVLPIDGALNPATQITTTLTNNLNDPANYVLELGNNFFATQGETQSVYYNVNVPVYTESCTPNMCLDCIYELEVSIKDQCGDEVLDSDPIAPGNQPYKKILGRYNPTATPQYSTSCPANSGLLNFSMGTSLTPITFNVPKSGTYHINKKLQLSTLPLQYYAQQYVATNSCIATLASFQQQALQDVDLSNCQNFDCASCSTSVMNAVATLTVPITQAQIDQMIEKCELRCDMQNVCTSREKLMRMHFKPGGYFAKYNPGGTINPVNNTITYTSTSVYSIFNPNNTLATVLNIQPAPLAGTSYSFSNVPSPGYGPYTIPDPVTNVLVPPSQLSLINYVSLHNTNFSNPWIKWHPEYCKLQFYCDGLISAITAYSNTIYASQTYNQACQAGVLFPFPTAIGIPAAPIPTTSCPSGCSPVSNQYIPLVGFTGSSNFSTAQISAALSAFTNSFLATTYSGPGGSTTANLYQFAVGASASVAISPTMPHLGSSSCDIDFAWQTYKNFYMSLLQNLIGSLQTTYLASWTPAQGGCASASALAALPNYVPVFQSPIPSSPIIVNFPSPTNTPTTTLVSNVSNSITTNCQQTCQGYVNQWQADLAACNIPPAVWNLMKNDLVAVCASGCDVNDPFGASNTSTPVNITVGGTPYSVSSFQDVLTAYGYAPGAQCNAFLINWPKPKGTPLGSSAGGGSNAPAGTPTLDACGCDKILQTHSSYTLGVANAQINPCVLSESVYFQNQLGVSLPYLSSYTCICSQAFVSPGNYNFANVTSLPSTSLTAFPMPEELACKRCIPCRTIEHLDNMLLATFGTSVVANINATALENYLNATFGLNNPLSEWLDFIADCGSNVTIGPNGTQIYGGNNGVTSTTNPQIYLIGNLLNSLQNLGFTAINNTTPYVLNQSNAASFFASSLWTLPNVPTATVGVMVSASVNTPNALLIQIFNTNSSYNCNFIVPLPPPLTPASVSTASNVIFAPVKGICSNVIDGFYNFQTNVSYYNTTSSVVVTASVSAYNSCYPAVIVPNIPNPTCEPYLCTKDLSNTTSSNSCVSTLINSALNTAQTNYNNYIQGVTATFIANYKNYCYANVTETFERGYLLNEYQYTLYYYDRSGNLVHTVPPASVQVLSGTPLTNAVNAVTNTSGIPAVYPAHSLNQSTGINSYVSHYGYTTFDAPTKQITPDAGETIYFYDHVGRLVASQSFKQQNLNLYSYTKYDDYGRITEVGELVVGTGIGTSLTNAITANPGQWQAYLSAYLKREVSFTYYDEPLNATTNAYFTGGQKNLRTRVSATTYEQVSDNNHNTFDHGNFYTYDDHGNVNQLITEKAGGFRGVVDYEYDLVSGNVNKVVYNKTKAEALYHKYCYDNDNRLKEVYTSTNGHVYQKDAKYFYYQHGPMARTELGEKQVQAADYAFTIQGWVKAVNSNALATSTDMGKDGENTTAYLSSQAGLHRNFAKDAAGYSLNYFGGDYNPIKAAAGNFLADLTSLNNASATGFKLSADAPDLYNGNISSMVTSIYDINPLSKDKGLAKPQITGYKYDQLHRIRHMKAYSSLCINTTNAAEHKEAIDLVSNQFNLPQNNSNYIDIYEMDFTYDKLGNIKTLERQGDAVFSGGTYSVKRMDKMTYNYQTAANMNTSIGTIQSTNRLTHVDEDLTIPSGNYPSDIEDQLPNNYIYDNNGQLTQDLNEEIASIEWTVSRKVSKVIRTNTSIKPDIIYQYNAFGQRVYKKVCNKSAPGVVDANSYKETFYNLDASGNVLAIYERVSTVVGVPPLFSLNVQTYCRQEFVYGAGRLGTLNRNIDMSLQLPPSGLNQFGVVFGEKDYELSNHLGNIITTVSDRKRAIDGTYNYVGYAAGNYNFDGYTYSSVSAGTGVFTQVTAPDGVVDAYVADIRTTADYYGFGLTMSARTYAQGGIKYRYGMNGQEKDDEIANGVYTAEYWEYDSRLGRRWNPDPVVKPFESPYACFRNNPIHYSDPSGMDGEEPINGGTLPEIEITASKTTQQKPAWDMTKDKKGNITFSGPYNGKNYSITYNPKKPQEFNISNGTTDIDFDFYTRMPDAKGTSKKSMSLNFEQRSEAKTYSGDKDVGKLKQTLIGTVKVIDVLKEAAKSNPHFGIGIVGNAYLPENTVGGTAVMEVDTKEDPRGYILETQFNDFTQKRADNVKNAFFGDINNVQTYSIDDGLKLGNPNIDPGARNRNNTGITIFLFEATFKPASVRNGD